MPEVNAWCERHTERRSDWSQGTQTPSVLTVDIGLQVEEENIDIAVAVRVGGFMMLAVIVTSHMPVDRGIVRPSA